MNKGKRMQLSVAVIAAFALVAAGCGGKGTGASTDSAAKAGGGGGAGQAPEKRGSITVSLYDRGSVPADEGTMDNNRWTKWVNENGPVDVKYVTVPRWESIQKFNVMFASGTAPDLIFEYDTTYQNQLYNQKQLMPLDDLIAKYSTTYKQMLDKYPMLKKVGTMSDGHMYFVGRASNFNPQHYLLIRNDWLKKLNLKAPTTPEELLQVAKAFTQNDPDGNGKTDTQGIGLSFVANIILNNMFGTAFTEFSTGQYPWVMENGKVVHDWDRIKASTAFMKQIYDAGYADKDFATDNNGEKQKQAWITGKLGIFGSNGADVKAYETLLKNVPDAEVIPLELPKTEFGQYSPLLTNPISTTGMVNAAAKDPASVVKMIDFMVSDNYTTTIQNGLEGVHYKMGANGCPEPIDPEKNKKELNYASDMGMLTPLVGKCYDVTQKANPTPAEKGMSQIINLARKAYMDPNKPMAGVTHQSYLPPLPQDLAQINTNANKTIVDMAVKAIVSGKSYTADQFIADAKATWEKAGGPKVDEYMAKYYEDNKSTAIMMSDIYKMAP